MSYLRRAFSSVLTTQSLRVAPTLTNSIPARVFTTRTTPSLSSPSTDAPLSAKSSAKPPPNAESETPLTETLRYFLDPADFYDLLKEKGMDFYTGVPDSLLKDFCAYVTDTAPKDKHIIAANEGQ